MPAATFDACKLLINNKKRNSQETKEINEENIKKIVEVMINFFKKAKGPKEIIEEYNEMVKEIEEEK